MMHKFKWLLTANILFLAACQNENEPIVIDVARPVKTMLVGVSESDGIRSFPGSVDAGQRADLSFRVDGRIYKMPVKEGDDVEEGQVLAQLDPKDFQIVLNDKQASFSRARADYNRAKQLVGRGHISRMDYDHIEADYKSRLADLNKAKQDLSYTVLKAPFAGTIAKRFFQNHEEVTFNEVVFTLNNNSLLEIKFNVPENIMLQVESDVEDDEIPVSASFDSVPGKVFSLTFKEIATKADSKTKTFLATYTMPAPKGLTVLPGMTATVTVDLSRVRVDDALDIYYLPLSAVTGDSRLQSRIWVVDEETMTVNPLAVKLGSMKGNAIEVLEGIKGQERVVIAGAGYMAEGMKVLLMKQPEQAEPRPEDEQLSIGR